MVGNEVVETAYREELWKAEDSAWDWHQRNPKENLNVPLTRFVCSHS